MRTKLVNHVRGTVKSFGERAAEVHGGELRASDPSADSLPTLKPALEPIYEVLDQVDEQIRQYDQTIERIAKRYPDVDVISQVNGVGVLTALVFLLTIEDKNRFSKSRTVGAFLGLRPRKSESGRQRPTASDHEGRRPVRAAAAGHGGQLHPGAVRTRTAICDAGGWSWPSAAARTPRSEPRSRSRESSRC